MLIIQFQKILETLIFILILYFSRPEGFRGNNDTDTFTGIWPWLKFSSGSNPETRNKKKNHSQLPELFNVTSVIIYLSNQVNLLFTRHV